MGLTIQKECQGVVTISPANLGQSLLNLNGDMWVDPTDDKCMVYPNFRLHQYFTVCVYILALNMEEIIWIWMIFLLNSTDQLKPSVEVTFPHDHLHYICMYIYIQCIYINM